MLKNDLMKIVNKIPDDVDLRLVIMPKNENDVSKLSQQFKKENCSVVLEQNAFNNWNLWIDRM